MLTRVLIVDDDWEDVELVKRDLVNSHFEFEVADCLHEGRSRFMSYEPEMIILDIGIPLNRGHGPQKVEFSEIVTFIRETAERSTVVMLTGHVHPDHIHVAIEAGACGFIDKSLLVNREQFEIRIREAMKFHRVRAGKVSEQGEVMAGMVIQRALTEYLILKMSQQAVNTGKIQDEKDRLTYSQAFAAGHKKGTEESRAKFAARWGAMLYTAGSFIYVVVSFIKGAWSVRERH